MKQHSKEELLKNHEYSNVIDQINFYSSTTYTRCLLETCYFMVKSGLSMEECFNFFETYKPELRRHPEYNRYHRIKRHYLKAEEIKNDE